MIFLHFSINNAYWEIKVQFLPTKIDMYFHIIGIKEDKNDKFNINIVLETNSISIAKDFLYFYNIVVLSISEYKKPISSFWELEISINHKQKNIKMFSSFEDIYTALKCFTMIGFDITYANFTNENKLLDNEVSEIIHKVKKEVAELQEIAKQEIQEQKEKEKKIYKDQKLNKILDISLSATKQIDLLLNNIDISKISHDKIRDIKLLSQELIKLRMGRNVDKMVEVLEKTYHKIYEIQQESISHKTPKLLIPWSSISDLEMEQEAFKYQKAQNIKKIWTKRSKTDSYYLSFETVAIYINFLLKDIKLFFKNISLFFYKLFDYLEIFFIFIILSLSIFLRFSKVSYSLSQNLFLYYFLIQSSVYWFVINIFKIFRKKTIKTNVFLLILALMSSYLIFLLIKNNLSF